MIIRELVSRLGFEVDDRPLKRVEQLLEGVKHRLEFLAAAEITKRLYEVSERFADWGRNLAITAGTIGVTTDELQKLAFVAERNGASTEEMGHALAHLSRHLYEAQNGSKEASEAFAKAGFTPDQVKSFKTSEEALFALSDKLHAMPSPIARVATAQELLGRGGYRMAYLLGQGSGALKAQGEEARKLGLILSSSQVGTLERLAFTFQKVEALARAAGAQIAAYFAPNLEDAVNALIKFYQVNKDVIGLNVTNWLDSFAYGIGYVMGIVLTFAQVLLNLDKRLDPNGNLLKWGLRLAGSAGGLLIVVKILSVLGGVIGALTSPITGVIRVISSLLGAGGLAGLVAISGAVVLAVGAIALAIQDIWASSHGQKSWLEGINTGLNDFIENGLSKFTEKLSKWGETVGAKVSAALLGADWAKIGDKILIALGAIFSVTYQLGESIATSIADGIAKTFRTKFPKLFNFLFPNYFGAETKEGEEDAKAREDIYKRFPQLRRSTKGGEETEEQTPERALDFLNSLGIKANKAGAALSAPPVFGTTAQAAPSGGNTFDVDFNINVTAPSGDGQSIAQVVFEKINDHWSQMMREASRSLSTQVVT